MFKCYHCKQEKPEGDFYPSQVKRKIFFCKKCIIEYRHSEKGKEKIKEYQKKISENRFKEALKRPCRICGQPKMTPRKRLCLSCFDISQNRIKKYNGRTHLIQSLKWQRENKEKYQIQCKSKYGEKLGLVKTILSCSCDYPKKQNHHFNNNWREVWKVCPCCHKWVDSFDYGYIKNPEIEVSNVRLD